MKSGRWEVDRNGYHQPPNAKLALPSIVPEPVMATSCRLEPVMNAGSVPGQLARGSIFKVAPLSSCRLMLLPMVNGPLRNVPDGTTTTPPPAATAALIVF